MKWMIKGAAILNVENSNGLLENNDIVIDGDKIAAIYNHLDFPQKKSKKRSNCLKRTLMNISGD